METKGEGKYTERSYGKFQRSFTLPTQVTQEKIDARFEDGVLKITLPKKEGSQKPSDQDCLRIVFSLILSAHVLE